MSGSWLKPYVTPDERQTGVKTKPDLESGMNHHPAFVFTKPIVDRLSVDQIGVHNAAVFGFQGFQVCLLL